MNAIWWILYIVLCATNILIAIYGCTFWTWLLARRRAVVAARVKPARAPVRKCARCEHPASVLASGEPLCAECLGEWHSEKAAREDAEWQRLQFRLAYPGRPLPGERQPVRAGAAGARLPMQPGGAAA